jgi:flagellar assembly factor FliW
MNTIAARPLDRSGLSRWSRTGNGHCVIHFDEGLIGLSEHKEFVLLDNEEISPFYLLQSTSDTEIRFLVIDPTLAMPEYYDLLPPGSFETVGLSDPSMLLAFVICSVGSTAKESTGNFLSPIIVNYDKMTGRQVILADPRLSIRHSLL